MMQKMFKSFEFQVFANIIVMKDLANKAYVTCHVKIIKKQMSK